MADPLSIASSVAGLLSLAMEITKLSYSFISDVRSAHNTQKQYLREVSALTDVLLRSEEAVQACQSQGVPNNRPSQLSQRVIEECMTELGDLRVELARPTHSIFWPIREKSLRKHIDELVRFRVLFSAFLTAQTSTTTSATHREVTKLSLHQSRAELLEWAEASANASTPAPTPLPGTGMWFLESDFFQAWVQGNGSPLQLWCHGPPGVGKSMLASTVLQYLLDNVEGEDRLVLQYFCDFESRKTQTKEAIWKSLLGQAIANGGQSVAKALSSYRCQRLGTGTVSLKDLPDVWHLVLSARPVVIVIDGPDELDRPVALKGVLAPFIKANCRIMVTSRDLPEIRSTLPLASTREILSDQSDLKKYVVSQFEENGMEELLERHPDLETEVVEKSNGIFLLGKILVNQLLELTTAKEMRKVLQSYPIQLEAAFETTLERILAQPKSHSALAHRVINWIASTERPLLASELIHGLAVDQEAKSMDDEDMVSVKTILKVCGGLVVINAQDGSISLVHTTVYTWLRSRGLTLTHEDIAGACLSYISLSILPNGPVSSAEEIDVRLRTFPFLSYAAQHWRAHFPDDMDLGPPGPHAKLNAMVDEFLGSPSLTTAAFQMANFKAYSTDLALRTATFDTMPTNQTTLHYAAFWDLPSKVPELLQSGFNISALDSQGWTALHWATFARKEDTVRALLHAGADVNLQDSAGWTPLFWAALHGDTSIVGVLLDNKASHLQQDNHGWTALRWAASRNNVSVITLFLSHHSKIKAAIKQLPLQYLGSCTAQQISPSIKGLLEDVADLRLDPHLDADRGLDDLYDLYKVLVSGTLKAEDLWTSGQFDPPVGNIWRTVTKAKTSFGSKYRASQYISLHTRGEDHWRSGLLFAAIKDGKLSVFRFLLALSLEANFHHSRPLLHVAALQKDPGFVEALLNFGAEVNPEDKEAMTPLQLALADGFEATATLLITKGANVNAYSSITPIAPLMLALGRSCGREEKIRLVRLLLEHGADVHMSMLSPHSVRFRGQRFAFGGKFDTSGMTAIHYACHTRDPDLIQLVIGAGGNPRALDNLGMTTLHHLVFGFSKTRCKDPGSKKTRNHWAENSSDALLLLLRECGTEYLSRIAECDACYTVSRKYLGIKHTDIKAEHTPLSLAIALKDWEMTNALNSRGAKFQTNIPLTPLLINAIEALEVEMVELLLQNGAGLIQESEDSHPTWQPLLDTLDAAGPQGLLRFEMVVQQILSSRLNQLILNGSLLHCLASRESETPEAVQIVLDAGASPYIPNDKGFDAFLIAASGGKEMELKVLLSHARAHPDQGHWTRHLPSTENPGLDTYCVAVHHISEALDAAGLINKIYGGRTLLHEAASHGRDELLQALLRNHADPDIGSEYGWRPIHFASLQGKTSTVDLLMRFDSADANILDNKRRSPMHLAAMGGHSETIETLLCHNAMPNLVDTFGFYPLHYAAWKSSWQTVKTLLRVHPEAALSQTQSLPDDFSYDRPSGLYARDRFLATPLHVAAMKGNVDIVRLIIETVERDVDTDTAILVRLRTEKSTGLATPGAGPTALHMVLNTGTFYGERVEPLSRPRLEIATILIDCGADVAGVADHFILSDVFKFREFPDLWDRLRVGISHEPTEDN